MVLTTHAVAGAALAQIIPDHPALGFSLAFVSHFILDMIPHWDYPLSTLEKSADGKKINQRFKLSPALVADFMKTGADLSLGLILTFVFFYPLNQPAAVVLVVGVGGGTLTRFPPVYLLSLSAILAQATATFSYLDPCHQRFK